MESQIRITTDYMYKLTKQAKSYSSDKIEQILREQEQIDIVENISQCNSGLKYVVRNLPYLSTLSAEQLSSMELYSCAAEAHNNIDKLKQHVMSKKILANVRMIGSPSAFGMAFVNSTPNKTIIKVSKDKKTPLDHEILVGMLATNSLRSTIPNFTQVYGYLSCGGTYIEKNAKTPSAMCLPGNEKYMLMEYIDGKSLGSMVRNGMSADLFCSVFMQVCFALRLAQQKNKFTHYDLHSGNVLVKPHHGMKTVTYPFIAKNRRDNRGRTVQMNMTHIASIIDYGDAYFEDPQYGGFLGRVLENANVLPKCHSLYDIYKLLYFCTEDAISSGNSAVLEVCRRLSKYFSDEAVEYITKEQRKLFFALMLDEETSPIGNIHTFIKYAVIAIKDINYGLEYSCPLTVDQDSLQKTPFIIPPRKVVVYGDATVDELILSDVELSQQEYIKIRKNEVQRIKGVIVKILDFMNVISSDIAELKKTSKPDIKYPGLYDVGEDLVKAYNSIFDIQLSVYCMMYLDRKYNIKTSVNTIRVIQSCEDIAYNTLHDIINEIPSGYYSNNKTYRLFKETVRSLPPSIKGYLGV